MPRKKGFKHTDETIAKMKAAKTGHPTSDETRLKISKANKGKKRSPEAIKRIRVGAIKREAEKARIRQENKKWCVERVGDILVLTNTYDDEKIYLNVNGKTL